MKAAIFTGSASGSGAADKVTGQIVYVDSGMHVATASKV